MIITKEVADSLSAQVKENPRLRMNLDMRTSPDDNSQRMLNALEPGTVLPIHRHMVSTETVIVLRGAIRQRFYDDNGNITGGWILAPQSEKMGISVPVGQWHNTEALETGTLIFECKDGAYTPITKEDILEL